MSILLLGVEWDCGLEATVMLRYPTRDLLFEGLSRAEDPCPVKVVWVPTGLIGSFGDTAAGFP